MNLLCNLLTRWRRHRWKYVGEKLDADEINKEFQADGNYMRFSTVVEWTVAYFKQLAGAKPAEQEGAEHG